MPDTDTKAQISAETLNCMEIWGGKTPGEQMLARPGLDLWVANRTSQSVGGGVHFVSSCASGRITRLLLADIVAGRPAFSDVAVQLRDLLKRHVNRIHQSECEHGMGRLIAEASKRGSCAATLMATYFAPKRRFTVCNAGHPPPFLFRAACNEWSLLPLACDAVPPLKSNAAVLDAAEYHRGSVCLGEADMVLFYSESLLECRTAAGMPLSVSELLNRLRNLGKQGPAQQASGLISLLEREHPENLEEMDATVILCRQSSRTTSWRDNLLAPLRLLRAVGDKTRLS